MILGINFFFENFKNLAKSKIWDSAKFEKFAVVKISKIPKGGISQGYFHTSKKYFLLDLRSRVPIGPEKQ